jgi:transposase
MGSTYDQPQNGFRKKEISPRSVYHHFSKWSHDGSLKKVWQASILTIQEDLNLSEINLDGTHTLAKKGGESVAYQGRKKGKTSNIMPFLDGCGYVIATTDILPGNRNDAYHLKPHLQVAFKEMKQLGLEIAGAYFNADAAFDTRDARKTCFNHGLIPNIPENRRNRKAPKRGRKQLFNQAVYHHRFTAERTFAWVDKYKRLLIRFERYDACFLGAHYIAFAMINLRHVLDEKFA